ncbi:unnamed protein product [Urochloa humidicola]
MRVAVVGAGVAGLAAAHELARSGGVQVTLYEKEQDLSGDAGTVTIDDGAGSLHLDTGFMVFNRVRTYIDYIHALRKVTHAGLHFCTSCFALISASTASYC